MSALRLLFITDIHHGPDKGTKKGSEALRLVGECARFANDAKPDAVVELGDRIIDQDRASDLIREREVAEAFRVVDAPIFHIPGNHDRDFLDLADNESIFGQSMANQTVDIGDWR